ncbi:MAG: AbrB/MazE/SpoVT family DNA-binding domain-containing protein [Halobacteriota archaeon]
MTSRAFEKMKNYDNTVIGEKDQIFTPVELRKKFGIETGDRFLVTAGAEDGRVEAYPRRIFHARI